MDENNKTFNVEGPSEPAKPSEVASPVEPEKHVADIKQEEVKPPHKKLSFNKSKLVKGIAGALLLGSVVSNCVLLSKVYTAPESVTKQEFNDLMSRISDIETSIAAQSTELSKAKEKIAGMEEDIKLDKEIIDGLVAGMEETQEAVKQLEAQIAAKEAELQKAIAEGDEKVKQELKASIAEKQAQIDSLKAESLKMQANVDAMKVSFEAKFAQVEAAIKQETQARVDAINIINGNIKSINDAVSQNAADIKATTEEVKKAKQSIEDLSKKVEAEVAALKEAIAKDLGELKELIEELSTNMGALKEALKELQESMAQSKEEIKANAAAIESLKAIINELKAHLDEQKEALEDLEHTKQNIISLLENKVILKNKAVINFNNDYDLYKDKYVEMMSEFNPSDSTLVESAFRFPVIEDKELKPLEGSITKLNQGKLALRIYNTKSINVYYSSSINPADAPITITSTDTGSYDTLTMQSNISYETTFNFVNGDLTINVKDFSKISTVNAVLFDGHGTISFDDGTTVTKGVKGATIKGSVTPDQDCKMSNVQVRSGSAGGALVRNATISYDLNAGTFEVGLPSVHEDKEFYIVVTIEKTFTVSVGTATGGSIAFTSLPPVIYESSSLSLKVTPEEGMICSKLLCSVNGGEQKVVGNHKPGASSYQMPLKNLPDSTTYPAGATIKFTPVFETKGVMTFDEFTTHAYTTSNIRINDNSSSVRTPSNGFVKGEVITIVFSANATHRTPNDQAEFDGFIGLTDQLGGVIAATYTRLSTTDGRFNFTCPDVENASLVINFTLPTK